MASIFDPAWITLTPRSFPYDRSPKIWCIGLNYRTHADEHQRWQPRAGQLLYNRPFVHVSARVGEISLFPPPFGFPRMSDAEGPELGAVI